MNTCLRDCRGLGPAGLGGCPSLVTNLGKSPDNSQLWETPGKESFGLYSEILGLPWATSVQFSTSKLKQEREEVKRKRAESRHYFLESVYLLCVGSKRGVRRPCGPAKGSGPGSPHTAAQVVHCTIVGVPVTDTMT